MRETIISAVLALFAFLFALATFGAILAQQDLNERVDPVLKLQYEKQYKDRAVK